MYSFEYIFLILLIYMLDTTDFVEYETLCGPFNHRITAWLLAIHDPLTPGTSVTLEAANHTKQDHPRYPVGFT